MARKKGSKNKRPAGVRFTPTVRPETKKWIDKQPKSQGRVIDKLVLAEIARIEKDPIDLQVRNGGEGS